MAFLMIFGSLQVFATVLRSLMPWPLVSSFFIPLSAFKRASLSKKFSDLPLAKLFDVLRKAFKEELARFSIFPVALPARSEIHSVVQTFAGSGVEAQALNIETLRTDIAERAARERKVECIIKILEAWGKPYKMRSKLSLNNYCPVSGSRRIGALISMGSAKTMTQ